MTTVQTDTFHPVHADMPAADAAAAEVVELSVVLPCLNEADTIAVCVTKALRALAAHGIAGEVVVADNGSTDGSQAIARELGARVVDVAEKGYGHALRGGIAAARGRYVLMADADDSYDLLELPKFLDKLREGYDLVQGCRLPAGGGTVRPGAMPFLHRWWGNPQFSLLARWWFRAPVHDVYCGMRAFTKECYRRLALRCTGMEFATEMIIKAARYEARIAEVPITLHPDGRKTHAPHLKTFRDGWRTLRFFLMVAPRWLFLEPGRLLVLLGLIGYAVALPGVTVRGVHFGAHTLVFSTLLLLCGYHAILFAITVKVYAISQRIVPRDERIDRLLERVTTERATIVGVATMLAGAALFGTAVVHWARTDFGNLDYERTMRWVVPGCALIALGFETVLAGFFLGILQFFRGESR
jgi:glycosyltransferase involved in cell wall biosynthesis